MARTSSSRGTIRTAIDRLLHAQGLANASWILDLDDVDEPPIFNRISQVDFLREVSEDEKFDVVLEAVLLKLQDIAQVAAKCPRGRRYFVCATLSDFDEWENEEQPIPTIAFYVNPDEREMEGEGKFHRFGPSYSDSGLVVRGWLKRLNPSLAAQFVEAELHPPVLEPELRRVYVGWRVNPFDGVISVGSKLGNEGSFTA